MSTSRTPSKNFPRATGAGIVNLKPSTPSLRMANGGQMDMYARASQTTNDTIALQNQMAGTSPSAAPADTRLTNESQRMGMAAGLLHSNQTPMAAPQITNTPVSLQMADGGVFDSLRRAVGMGAPETMREKFARQDAERAASRPQPAAPAPAAPPMMTPAPMGSQSVIDGRMKAAGLQNGGQVPGTGKGDKIPAKYEPGEFVVSNDMLDAAPSLRGELHSLRNAVLAKKGMTPEQADAKAVVGGGLRAVNAFDPASYLKTTFPGGGADLELPTRAPATAAPAGNAHPFNAAGYTPPTVNSEGVRTGGPNGQTKTNFSVERPVSAGSPAGVPGGAAAPDIAAGAAEKTGLRGSLWSRAKSGVGSAASGVKNAGRTALEFAGPASAVYAGGDALTSAATNQLNSLNDHNLGMMTNAGGGDDTAFAAAILQQGRANTAASAPAVPPKPPQGTTLPDTGMGSGRGRMQPFGTPGAAPSNQDLRSRDFSAELNALPSNLPKDLRSGVVHKTVNANGRVTYSGRDVGVGSDGNTQFVDGTGRSITPRGSVQVAAGAPTFGPNGSYVTDNQAPTGEAKQRAINQSLMGPGGTKMSPNDVATMAANQRDGVDLYRGTSQDMSLRGGAGGGRDSAEIARLKELIASPIGTPGRKSAAALLQQHMQNQGSMDVARLQQETTLRGKQMEIDIAQARRNAIGQAAQAAGGDPVKTAQILSNLGLTDDAAHFTTMAGQAQTREKGAQDIARTNDDSATKDLESMAVDVNKNGESVISQGKLSTARGVAKQVTPGYFNMDANQRAAVLPQVQSGVNIVDGMNAARNTGWLQKVGWDGDSTEINTLPNLRGAKVEEVGAFEGLRTPNVGRTDYAVRLADGTTRYIPRNKVGNKELETLRSQGATLAK